MEWKVGDFVATGYGRRLSIGVIRELGMDPSGVTSETLSDLARIWSPHAVRETMERICWFQIEFLPGSHRRKAALCDPERLRTIDPLMILAMTT